MASTVGTTVGNRSIRVPHQRNAFYAAGRFWVFYQIDSDNDLVYRTSTDGTTWGSEIGVAPLPSPYGANYDLCFDETYIHYVRNVSTASGYRGIMYRRGTPQADGTISWSAAEQTVLSTGYVADDMSLCIDSNGYPWIGYGARELGTPGHASVITSSTNDGTWATKAGYPYMLYDYDYWHVALAAQTSGKVAAILGLTSISVTPAPLRARMYDGASWSDAELVTADTTDGRMSTNDYQMFCITSIGDEVHITYHSASDKVQYLHGTEGDWSSVTTLISSIDYRTSPVICADGSDLYVFWLRIDDHVYYCNYTGSWGSVVDWIDETTDDFTYESNVQCFDQSCGGFVGLTYQTATGSPYNVRFAFLGEAEAIIGPFPTHFTV